MTQERAGLGFGDALDNLNESEWKPTPTKKKLTLPEREASTKVAKEAGFKSREAEKPKKVRAQRRRRTGRSAQLNVKVKPETIEEFYAIADGQGWGLGETLENAVELLQTKYGKPR